ncbi:Glycerophosphoryl diester phosphodiesterase, partial [Tetrabaena socialis]
MAPSRHAEDSGRCCDAQEARKRPGLGGRPVGKRQGDGEIQHVSEPTIVYGTEHARATVGAAAKGGVKPDLMVLLAAAEMGAAVPNAAAAGSIRAPKADDPSGPDGAVEGHRPQPAAAAAPSGAEQAGPEQHPAAALAQGAAGSSNAQAGPGLSPAQSPEPREEALPDGTPPGGTPGVVGGDDAVAAGAWPLMRWRGPMGIAHRGASFELPEHTREAYERAVEQGAHFIECDVVLTKDLVPVCRHEPNLLNTTDAQHKFPDRMRTYTIDGENVTGIFSVDLTAAEVATLRAVQPWPFRDQTHNGQLSIATLADYLAVAKKANRTGIYPETKHPGWTNALPAVRAANTSVEDILLAALQRAGFDAPLGSPRWMQRPVFIQSFEASSLRYMAARTCAPMVLLLGDAEGWVAPDSGLTLEQLASNASLAEISGWASAVGPSKATVVRWQQEPPSGHSPSYVSSGLVERFHSHELQVHVYTIRPEPRFFLPHLAEHAQEGKALNVSAEYDLLLRLVGVDAIFTDSIPSFREWQGARGARKWRNASSQRFAKWTLARQGQGQGGRGQGRDGGSAAKPDAVTQRGLREAAVGAIKVGTDAAAGSTGLNRPAAGARGWSSALQCELRGQLQQPGTADK